jgi:hypothetical protein
MAIRIRSILKNWFKTGDKPTEAQFADWIDSFYHKTEDTITAADATESVAGSSKLITSSELNATIASDTEPASSNNVLGIKQLWRLWDFIEQIFLSKASAEVSYEFKNRTFSRTTNLALSTPNVQTQVIRNVGSSNITVFTDYTGCKINSQTNKSIVVKPGQFATIKAIDSSDADNYLVFVTDEVPTSVAAWGSISGTLSSQTDLQAALNGKQNSLTYTPENTANKGQANGYVSLNSNIKIDSSYLEDRVITITTSTSITTATNNSAGLGQNNRHVIIDNSTNAINFTLNGGVSASYLKHGTGVITVLRGSGRELYVNGSNVASVLFNGLVGSTMSLTTVGTRDYVSLNNI